MARHDNALIPSSKIKLSIAKIFKDEGFIQDYEVIKGKPQSTIKIYLKYIEEQPALLGLEKVSKPGLRVYVGKGEIPRVYGGLGIAILSTSKGIMTGQKAWQLGLGGELLLYVW
jgi:small subunit ribosomal protein S8